MADEKKKSLWAMAVSEHMRSGGSFPRKGSADYEAVMKIKERMAAPAKTTAKAVKTEATAKAVKTEAPKATPVKRQTSRDKEIERLGEEIRLLKDRLGGDVKHSVKATKDELSICHNVPMAKIKATRKSKIPLGDEDE